MSQKKELIDVIAELKDSSETHEKISHRTLKNFRSEINNSNDGFAELAITDLDHEEDIGQKLLSFWLNDKNEYKYPPDLYATYLENHILRLEKRSRYLGLSVTGLGVFAAIFSVNFSENWPFVILLAFFSVLSLGIMINLDKNIVHLKQVINHLKSFTKNTPNKASQPTPKSGAAEL